MSVTAAAATAAEPALVVPAGEWRPATRTVVASPQPFGIRGTAAELLEGSLFGVVLAGLLMLALVALPRVGGLRSVTILSGSMGSAAPVGSVVVLRPVKAQAVRTGNVVLLQRPGQASDQLPVLHRVVALERVDTQIVAKTKGDANTTTDPGEHVLPDIVMTPLYVVPLVGFLFGHATRSSGTALIYGIAAVTLGLLSLQHKARQRPRTT